MLEFIKEGLDGGAATSTAAPAAAKASKEDDKKLRKLEDENERLRAEYEKLKAAIPFDSLEVLKTFKVSEAKGRGRSEGESQSEPNSKGQSKGKGDGKGSGKESSEARTAEEGEVRRSKRGGRK